MSHNTHTAVVAHRGSGRIEALEAQIEALEADRNKWRSLALTDQLTGLYHRRAGDQYLKTLMQRDEKFVLFSIDLNKFKAVNDQAGHEAGDQVLKAIAHAFRADIDHVFRWGGDEFIAIARCGPEEAPSICHRVKSIALGVNLDEWLPSNMQGHRCGAAVGWAASGEADGLASMMKVADERMYADKGCDR